MGINIGLGRKSQNTILQGLKGRYPSAMGIAHGRIIVPSQGLKRRHTIAIGIAYGMAKSQKKTSIKTQNIYGIPSLRDSRGKVLSAIPNYLLNLFLMIA